MRTADRYRELAAESEAVANEPMTRDNFVSRNAAREMAARYRAAAELLDNDMKAPANALFLNGEVASFDQRKGDYGHYWALNDQAARVFGKRFYTPSQAKNHLDRDRAKGFTFGTVLVDAYLDQNEVMQYDWKSAREGHVEIVSVDDWAGRSSMLGEATA